MPLSQGEAMEATELAEDNIAVTDILVLINYGGRDVKIREI